MVKVNAMGDEVRLPIYALLTQAKAALENGQVDGVERLCDDAYNLIPNPKFGWDVSYMCLYGIVKYLRSAGNFDKAIKLVEAYLESGYYSLEEDGPFFWLGTLHYEKENFSAAFRYMQKAFTMSGGRCFVGEDPKYKRFFKNYK